MLNSPVPLVLLWGPAGIMLYNDAYGAFAGNRHPGILGMAVLDAWPEAADLNREVMAVGMAGGTLEFKDRELVLNRRGTPEQAWLDLFYSPVIAEDGKPGGVVAVVVETTERVQARRERRRRASGWRTRSSTPPLHGLARRSGARLHLHHAAHQQPSLTERDRQDVPEALPDFGARLRRAARSSLRHGRRHVGHASPVALQRRAGAEPRAAPARLHLPAGARCVGHHHRHLRRRRRRHRARACHGGGARERAPADFLDNLGRATANLHDADEILQTTTRLTGRASRRLDLRLCRHGARPGSLHHSRRLERGGLALHRRPLQPRRFRQAGGEQSSRRAAADRQRQPPELAPKEAQTFLDIGIAATICMPLVKEGRLTALMAIHDKAPRRWLPRELAMLREVTERSWAHIERVATRRRARKRPSACGWLPLPDGWASSTTTC